jgi:hypothetical protein
VSGTWILERPPSSQAVGEEDRLKTESFSALGAFDRFLNAARRTMQTELDRHTESSRQVKQVGASLSHTTIPAWIITVELCSTFKVQSSKYERKR